MLKHKINGNQINLQGNYALTFCRNNFISLMRMQIKMTTVYICSIYYLDNIDLFDWVYPNIRYQSILKQFCTLINWLLNQINYNMHCIKKYIVCRLIIFKKYVKYTCINHDEYWIGMMVLFLRGISKEEADSV